MLVWVNSCLSLDKSAEKNAKAWSGEGDGRLGRVAWIKSDVCVEGDRC